MASTLNKTITEEMIDECSMPKATRLCKTHEIKCSYTKLSEIKCLLKSRLICNGTKPEEACAIFKTIKHDVVQEDLFDICEQVKNFAVKVKKTKGPAAEQLNAEFPSIHADVELSVQKMKDSVPTVLVIGETGAGKSSFINLLLGEAYFPCHILSSSHVLCEIRYADKPRAEFQKADSNSSNETLVDQHFIEDMKRYLQLLDDEEKAVYRLAKVYLPCNILKSGLVIVDSPGIGESEEMTNMVIDYILKADAFIYIIDSTNAGGMQDRVKKLVQQVYRKSVDKQKIYRPDNALFICNKWDDIPLNERETVLKDIRKKIKAEWQNCEDNQIICFSTKEATFIQKEGRMAPKFKYVLQSMKRLVDVGQQMLVIKGFRLLFSYMGSCIHHFDTYLSQLKMSNEDRVGKHERIKGQLSKLNSTIEHFFDVQRKTVKSNQESVTQKLHEFMKLNIEGNQQKICRFEDHELPKGSVWTDAALEVRYKVYNSLMCLIQDWIKRDGSFTKLAAEIEKSLALNCPDFEKEIYCAQQAMAGIEEDNVVNDEPVVEFVPKFFQKKLEALPLWAKIGMGIGLSPVLLAGTIIRTPIFGIQLLYKGVTVMIMENDFIAAQCDKEKLKEVCQKYAKKVVDDISSEVNLDTIVDENLRSVVSYLCKQELKMRSQIESNENYLKKLDKDMADDEQVKHDTMTLKKKSDSIYQQLKRSCPNKNQES